MRTARIGNLASQREMLERAQAQPVLRVTLSQGTHRVQVVGAKCLETRNRFGNDGNGGPIELNHIALRIWFVFLIYSVRADTDTGGHPGGCGYSLSRLSTSSG